MPEILKHPNGDTNWSMVISAISAALILVLQQWQTYRIAELREEANIQKVMFLDKEKVYKIAKDLENRMEHLEGEYIPRDDLNGRLNRIEKDIDFLRKGMK